MPARHETPEERETLIEGIESILFYMVLTLERIAEIAPVGAQHEIAAMRYQIRRYIERLPLLGLGIALGLLLLALLAAPTQAQTVTTPIGTLAVTSSSIHYELPHRSATVSRDLLASLPQAGRYQHVGDDVALLLDVAQHQGQTVPTFAPAADTSVVALVDSLIARLDRAEAARDEAQAALGDTQAALTRAKRERDEARADAQALTSIIDRIADRLAERLGR